MKQITIFDLDRTITRTGTFTRFLFFAACRLRTWRLFLIPIFLASMIGYPLRLIDRKSIKNWGFKLILNRRIDWATLAGLSKRFAQSVVAENIYPDALDCIERNRAEGRILVMATASPDFYAEEIGKLLAFDAVIATRQSRSDVGEYLYKIDGENCYGQVKLERIRDWLTEMDLPRQEANIRFYSDDVSDSVTLDWADQCYAVNPTYRLAREARLRGWPVLNFG